MKRIVFESPVEAVTYKNDDYDTPVKVKPTQELCDMINLQILKEFFYSYKGLAMYSNIDGVSSIRNRVILDDNQLICQTVVFVDDNFDHKLLQNLADEISGQYSDGWGEGFEQISFQTKTHEEAYVSFWQFEGFYIRRVEQTRW